MVNADPHGDAWLVVVKLDDPSELDALMSAADYQGHIDKEGKGLRAKDLDALLPSDDFVPRHIGPRPADIEAMLALVGYDDMDALVHATVPDDILMDRPLDVPEAKGEFALTHELRALASKNQLKRDFIGLGYYDTITPPVIQRNILENPGWYTQYTPYQAEISQGRLEALLNFQTMVADLTGLPLANSSLLDEATAAAEAMSMSVAITRNKKNGFFVADDCHPQTIAVVETRARPLEIDLSVGPVESIDFDSGELFGILLSYPTTDGRIEDYEDSVPARERGGGRRHHGDGLARLDAVAAAG